MAGILDDFEIELACPGCSKNIKKRLAWFKRDFTCPHCGAVFKTAQFAREIQKVEKSIADLQRQIGKI